MQNKTGTKRMVGMAILIAMIVILQTVAALISRSSLLPFNITLSLIPIVVGAAMYGPKAGAVLGGALGAVILIYCISGLDQSGYILWTVNPPVTAILCLLKTAAAGFVAGFVYLALAKKNKYIGVLCSAVICPVVNTSIFISALALLYRGFLTDAASESGASVLYVLFIGVAGINFLIEFGLNIVLSPGIVRIINAVKKSS